MANARKDAAAEPAPATEPATAPILAPDEAWLQNLVSIKDASMIAAQAKRSERAAREDAHNREIARLQAAFATEDAALAKQVEQHERIAASCDLAIEHLVGGGGSNVVQLQPAPQPPQPEDPQIPQFLRQPVEVSPAA